MKSYHHQEVQIRLIPNKKEGDNAEGLGEDPKKDQGEEVWAKEVVADTDHYRG